MKKKSCTPINPNKYSCYGLKKNSYKEFDNEEKFPQLENSPSPPITFLMVRRLIKLLPDSKTMATLVNYTCKRFTEFTPNLNHVHHFLDRCYKGRYISRKLNIRELLERSDCPIFRKALRTNSPLVKVLPERNFTNYTALRKPYFHHPAILATERVKSSYVNRLIFSYDINSFMLIVE